MVRGMVSGLVTAGFRGGWYLLRFGWPIWLYMYLDSIAFGHQYWVSGNWRYGAYAGSPMLLCLIALALVRYDEKFKAVSTISAVYALALAFTGTNVILLLINWVFDQPTAEPPIWGLDRMIPWLFSSQASWSTLNLPVWIGRILTVIAALAVIGLGLPAVRKAAMDLYNKIRRRKGLKYEVSTSGLHGSARWASQKEIDSFDKFKSANTVEVILGQMEKDLGKTKKEIDKNTGTEIVKPVDNDSKLVRFQLGAHATGLAPSRSGKGTSLIITNVINFDGPVIVVDPKAESLMVAGRKRSEKYTIQALDPFGICADLKAQNDEVYAPPFAALNPLDFVREDESFMVSDINVILECMTPPAKPGEENNHFRMQATRLLRALIVTVMKFEPPQNRNLITVQEYLSMFGGTDEEKEELDSRMKKAGSVAKQVAQSLSTRGEEERGGVLSSAENILEWLDAVPLRKAVEKSTFRLEDILEGKIDIYICIPEDQVEACRAFIRLMVALPTTVILRRKTKKRTLLILDEASVIGRLEAIVKGYRIGAGKGLSIWTFAQTVSGLKEAYGEEGMKEIIGNSEFVAVFGQGSLNFETCEWVSKGLGDITALTETTTSSTGSSGAVNQVFNQNNASSGMNKQETKRPLMIAGDIAQMDVAEMIFLMRSKATYRPLKLWQAAYFRRKEFDERWDVNPHVA